MNFNPILAKSLSVTRYKFEFEEGELNPTHFMRNLFDHADNTAIEVKSGFCGLDDPTEILWDAAGTMLAPFIAVGFRIDRRSVPSKTIALETHKQVKAELEKLNQNRRSHDERIIKEGLVNPSEDKLQKPKISKGRVQEIKNQVKLKLVANTPAKPKHIGIVYDEDRSTLYIIGASESDLKIIEAAFHHILMGEDVKYNLQRMTVSSMADSLDASGAAFITSLWTSSVLPELLCGWEFGESLTVAKSKDEEVITAKSKSEVHHQVITKAIEEGAHINSAQMRLVDPGNCAWSFTLTADMSVTSLYCPIDMSSKEQDEDPRGAMLEKLYLITQFFIALDTILAIRLCQFGHKWQRVLPEGYRTLIDGSPSPSQLESMALNFAKALKKQAA